MSVFVWGSPYRHRWAATDPRDRRVAWTFCGIRFVWGRLPVPDRGHEPCPECVA